MMRIRLRQERLQELIASRNLSQNHWAVKLGLSRGHWSDIVNGKHPYPSAKTRQRLLETFRVSSEDLFEVDAGAAAGHAVRRRLPDRYVVDREVGQGGMGTVYLARDVRLGRAVAIKVVSSEAVGGIGADQFLKEIRYTSRLHHPNILPLYDAGTVDGQPYYVMPYVGEGSLAARIEHCGRVPLADAVEITRGISAALSHAHDNRILHCDVKPGNVLLAGNHAFVSDFGLARAIHLEAFEWGRPQEIDSSAGTPAYVSPEQASGEANLDARSDVYSLACVVFEMLTGRPPVSGRTTVETVAQRFVGDPPDACEMGSGVPPQVASVLQQGMMLNGAGRYSSVTVFRRALEHAAGGGSFSPGARLGRLGSRLVARTRAVTGFARPRRSAASPDRPQSRKARRMLTSLLQDATHALQGFRRAPAFTVVVVLTLAFGIAANTLTFSLMNPFFLRGLPFDEPSRLVQVGHVDAVSGWDMARFSLSQYRDYRERSDAFDDLAAYSYGRRNLTGGESPERVQVGFLTSNMLALLGVAPSVGRGFLVEEEAPDRGDVVLLDHGLWQRRYGADPDIVGKAIVIDGRTRTVVGVMASDFVFPFGGIGLWLPVREDPGGGTRDYTYLHVVGRLKSGWTAESARAELSEIHRELSKAYPEVDGAFTGISVKPLRQALNFAWDVLRAAFALQLAAVGFTLLIVCVNVASLLLARGMVRSPEMAVRAALGAGRRRIVRQLLTESSLLAVVGGALGLVLARLAAGLVLPMIPEDLYRVGEASLDGNVLLFAVTVTVVTLLLFGLAPAMAASRTDLTVVLREGGGGVSRQRSARARRVLVIFEVAMAVVLISGVGLATRSLLAIQSVDLGFDPDGVTVFSTSPQDTAYPEDSDVVGYYERIVSSVEALPGVRGAATASTIPQNHEVSLTQVAASANAGVGADEWPRVLFNRVSAGYFETMGVGVIAGRDFEPSDGAGDERVVVISQRLASLLWPGTSAVGRALLIGEQDDESRATVVGVVADVRHEGLTAAEHPQVYRPMSTQRSRYLVVAGQGPTGTLANEVRQTLLAVHPDTPVTVRSMADIGAQNVLPWSMSTLTLAVLGLSALVLATLGIYGVVAYSAAQQRREIGVRMALGATPRAVRTAFVLEGLKLSSIGIAIGFVLSAVANRVLESALYGIGGFDLISLGGATLLFVAVTVLASLTPAVRASRVEPMTVLRYE